MLEILSFILGPVQTNAYLVADPETKEAVVIDPAWDGHIILKAAQDRGWRIGHLWYTHAHFDHIGGAAAIADALYPLPHVALHPDDHVLWRSGGGGAVFGLDIDPGPEPTIDLVHGMLLKLGSNEFEVRFTPGHTRGHCALYVPKEHICFCGDLIFNRGVGRTDLPGGDWNTLENSIRTQIFNMPDETRLLSGHGPETTVGAEKMNNPFVGIN
jgi:hydroxyacylglutathione hydrolase